MNDLYDSDILTWSERQAELLRRIAAGEPPNEMPDWRNIIEELADVGRNSLRACRSLVVQAVAHEMKARAWPNSEYVARWCVPVRFGGAARRGMTATARNLRG